MELSELYNEHMKKSLVDSVESPSWFKRFEAVAHAKGLLENFVYAELEPHINFYYDDFGFDTYDSSIEYHKVQNTGRLSIEAQTALKGLGLSQCWLNHIDGTETFYRFVSEGSRTVGHRNWCGAAYPITLKDGASVVGNCRRKKGHDKDHGLPTEEDLVSTD